MGTKSSTDRWLPKGVFTLIFECQEIRNQHRGRVLPTGQSKGAGAGPMGHPSECIKATVSYVTDGGAFL